MVVDGKTEEGKNALIKWQFGEMEKCFNDDSILVENQNDEAESDDDLDDIFSRNVEPDIDGFRKVVYQSFSGLLPSMMTNFNIHVPVGKSHYGVTFVQSYSPEFRILSERIVSLRSKAFYYVHAPGSKEEGMLINIDSFEKNGRSYTNFMMEFVRKLEHRISTNFGFLNRLEIRVRVPDPSKVDSLDRALEGAYHYLVKMTER